MAKQPLPLSDDIEQDPIHLAAADWIVRLQSTEVSLEETLAWQAWLHESPLNAQAFARIEEISDVMRHVAAPPAASLRELARDDRHWVAVATSAPTASAPVSIGVKRPTPA